MPVSFNWLAEVRSTVCGLRGAMVQTVVMHSLQRGAKRQCQGEGGLGIDFTALNPGLATVAASMCSLIRYQSPAGDLPTSKTATQFGCTSFARARSRASISASSSPPGFRMTRMSTSRSRAVCRARYTALSRPDSRRRSTS